MEKKKIEIIITVVLVIVFILILSGLFKKTGPKVFSAKGETQAVIVPQEKFKPLFKARPKEKEAVEEETRDWGRDPFTLHEMGDITVGETIGSLKLMGITMDRKKPMAIINNNIVSTGSRIGKFTVLNIQRDKVIVTDGSANFELDMSK